MNVYGPLETTYRGQRDNGVNPAITCNVTMMVTLLSGAGVKLPPTGGRQPEDMLAKFAASDRRVAAYMKQQHPWETAQGWLPYTEPDTLAYAANLWVGSDIVAFTRRYSLEQVVRDLARNRPVGVIGWFTKSGHFVTIIGVETSQNVTANTRAEDVDLGLIVRFRVHDPYGDYHTHYADPDGAANTYSAAELYDLLCDAKSPAKWAHHIVE